MRIFPLVLSGLIVAGAPLPALAAQAPRLDTVAGPGRPGRLADALLALAAQADVNIAFDATLVGDRRTRGFAGPTTLHRALDALLDGSGLTYVLAPNGVVKVLAVPPPRASAPKPLPVAPAVEPSTLIEPIAVVGYRVGLDQAEARARRYDGMVQVITADAVGKLPDSNIADALERLPSVYRISDQGEGRYLSLRGLSQVLDTVTFNGVTIAASDTDGRSGRAAPLDVLSASAISEVEIHNVITPDRDAGAIGGLIDVRTPTAHDFAGRVASVTAEIGAVDNGGGRDIHAVGGAFADTFGPGGAFGVYLAGEHWVREYFSPFYDTAEIVPSDKGLYPDRILVGASMGRRERNSLTGSLDWRGEGRNAAWLRMFAANYTDEELRPEFMFYRRGALATDGGDTFSWRGLRVRTETRRERQDRPVRQYVLGGRWAWNDDWTVEGSVNRTTARELNPYLDYYETLGDMDPLPGAPDIGQFRIVDGVSIPRAMTAPDGRSVFDASLQNLFRIRRISSTVREDITTQQIDLTRREMAVAGMPVLLRTGLKRLSRIKSVADADNRFNFTGAATLADPTLTGWISRYGQADAIVPGLDFPFPDPAGFEALFDRRPDLFTFDAAASRENSVEDRYRIRETIWAGYLMGEVAVTPALRVTLGARVERTRVDAIANAFVADITGAAAGLPFGRADILPTSGGRGYVNFAPALLAKWDAGGAWVLRASSTQTFARPDYVDLAPIARLSVSVATDLRTGESVLSGVNEIGNPQLRAIESRNWDVSAQYHLPRRLGWISAAGFYKALDGLPFEVQESRPGETFGGARFDQYVAVTKSNVGHGHVAGVELSLRYDFRDAPAPFDGFGVLANAAFLDSQVSAPGRAPRRLADQAKALYAAQLYYERGRFQARLGYAYQGRAPRNDQWSDPTGLNYRQPISRLDLKILVDLPNAWRVTLAGANLTNEPYRTDRSTEPYLTGSGPGYELYGREYRLGLTRRW
ncbi:TonB-dependent receptor [Caulobacter sp.]|uniref:TonB-dependent receptor n=1 Tax=Caulobacter sp. TaxID=78 RepID=UPI001B1CE4F3|nr:TonB-dependent receptor [Caulobacter sp.]MBO9545444.1 TonB-dependent receptor [Caulobacter sp.]